jgi:hypothetical protein
VSREYRDVVFPIEEGERKRRDTATVRHAAVRLRDVLASTAAVPRGLAKGVTEKLDELIAVLGDAKAHATNDAA